jgi:hypothetical protein
MSLCRNVDVHTRLCDEYSYSIYPEEYCLGGRTFNASI